jgi:hypothetical protein
VSAFAYSDLFYTDRRPGVNVRATVTLIPAVTQGRRSDAHVRWRPNHNFGLPDGRTFYIGEVEFDSADTIEPGETRAVLIRFLDGPGLRENLEPGRTWRIQEGPKLIATATLTEVLGET